MKTKIFLTILLLGFLQSAFAYPITPRPLRLLVAESEFIVYANVTAIEEVQEKHNKNWYNGHSIVTLEIQEVLQGSVTSTTIKVRFNPNLTCPAPARYITGTKVLAFLDKSEGEYRTHALSYGAKTITKEATFELYKKRILEIQEISTISDEELKSTKTLNWLISCAKEKELRWEGIFELSGRSDFIGHYDDKSDNWVVEIELNKSQKSILRKTFFELDQIDYDDLGLISLFVHKNDKELLDFLITKLKSSNSEDIWGRNALVDVISAFAKREDLEAIAGQINNISYSDDKREEKISVLIDEFIKSL